MSIITITRGSLKATERLANKISSELNCPIVTRENVIKAAEKYGIKETGLGDMSFIDKSPNLWDKLSDRRKHYLACFQTALLDYALEGSFVYHGHLAQFLLGEIPFVLRVLLTAPLEYRIKTLMEEGGETRDQVVSYIKLIDERRERWSQFLYSVHWKAPSNYDIVFNLQRINLNLATGIILKILPDDQFKSSPESSKILKNLHFAAKAKVKLQQSPRTKGSEVNIDADAETGKIVISGNTPEVGSHMWEEDMRNVLSELDEVKEIIINKSIISYYE